MVIRGNVIEWVGKTSELPVAMQEADRVIDAKGHVFIPGKSTSMRHSLRRQPSSGALTKHQAVTQSQHSLGTSAPVAAHLNATGAIKGRRHACVSNTAVIYPCIP